jgi:hypothetical protein
MHGHHCLVGGDHGLAGGNRSLDQGVGWTIGAADQLHHHIDRGIRGERHRIFVPAQPGERHASVARTVAGRYRRHRDRPAGTGGHHVGVVAQQLEHATADSTQTGNRDGERMAHWVASNSGSS